MKKSFFIFLIICSLCYCSEQNDYDYYESGQQIYIKNSSRGDINVYLAKGVVRVVVGNMQRYNQMKNVLLNYGIMLEKLKL